MSSDRRSRRDDRPRRNREEDSGRRRTAFVPRQGANRPTRSQPRERDQRQDRSRRPAAPRYRPQQPPYRAPRRPSESGYDDDFPGEQDDQIVEDERAAPRRTPRRSGRFNSTRRHDEGSAAWIGEFDDNYDDSFIDEEDWYEEEAAAGGYRPRGSRRRGAPALPRPSITISRPNLPRPTVPAGIREAALAQSQGAVVLTGLLCLSIIGMVIVALNRADHLAPAFATHISASGLPEAFRTEAALWELPLMAGALLLMNLVAAWFLAGYSLFTARFLLATSVIVQVLIWVALIRIAF